MKTQKHTIEFKKSSLIELDVNKMNKIKGGSLSPALPSSIIVITQTVESSNADALQNFTNAE